MSNGDPTEIADSITAAPAARLALCGALALLALACALLLAPAGARAAEAPTIERCEASFIRATRAKATIVNPGAQGSKITEMQVELSTAGPDGPWSTTGVETNGHPETSLQKLTPSTTYYLRCRVANGAGRTEAKGSFTTHAPEAPEVGRVDFGGEETGATVATVHLDEVQGVESGYERVPGSVETNGAETTYYIEYALPESGHAPNPSSPNWKPVTSGTVTVAEDYASVPAAKLSGLTPATEYYVRARAVNAIEPAAESVASFQTTPAYPKPYRPQPPTATATSARFSSDVYAAEAETNWRFEYAPAEPGGAAPPQGSAAWRTQPSLEGTIASSEATRPSRLEAELDGLAPGTVYYVRLFASNGNPPDQISVPERFETAGPPTATTFATHAVDGESIRLLGLVAPHSAPINEIQSVGIGGGATGGSYTLALDGQATAPIPFGSSDGEVLETLRALPAIGAHNVSVRARPGGYAVEFTGSLAGVDVPQLTADGSGLTPSGAVTVTTLRQGFSYQTHYRFEYITQSAYEADGEQFGAGTETTAPALAAQIPFGSEGFGFELVGADLPQLAPGSYRYRLAVSNTTPGDPEAHGSDQAFVLAPPPAIEPAGPCANEAMRTGPSAALPDCRAYELVTPADKHGAQDIDKYGLTAESSQVGEDGDHFLYHDPGLAWGTSPDSRIANYLFSRTPSGWLLNSARPQGYAGPDNFLPSLFSSDLTGVGLEVGWKISLASRSAEIELGSGPFGGPYRTIATVSRGALSEPEGGAGLAGASPDLSKLVLATADRNLVGHSATVSGNDLFEYSAGTLRQLNVGAAGASIGSCGASLVHGKEGYGAPGLRQQSSPHAVSADGERVFFEAVPSADCSAATHLYMRSEGGEPGAQTVDIGEYRFLAADPEGTKLLLERANAATHEVFLYEVASSAYTHLFDYGPGIGRFDVSTDLGAIYFFAHERLTPEAPPSHDSFDENLYRYDVATRQLRFLVQSNGDSGAHFDEISTSPDGRYFYWLTYGGGDLPGPPRATSGTNSQVYRYDAATDAVQCISCSSPFNPAPALTAHFQNLGPNQSGNEVPEHYDASANGDFVFFDTPAALLPQDVDGEEANFHFGEKENSSASDELYTRSSDVYEWRAEGINGCAHFQGCLALISSGHGGYRVAFLGTDPSGHDAFFATHAQLVPADRDSAADVYDARIGGGFPPAAPRPVECEGDACSSPSPAPDDATPGSATYGGPGNEHPAPRHRKRHHRHRHAAHPKSGRHRPAHHKRARRHHGGAK